MHVILILWTFRDLHVGSKFVIPPELYENSPIEHPNVFPFPNVRTYTNSTILFSDKLIPLLARWPTRTGTVYVTGSRLERCPSTSWPKSTGQSLERMTLFPLDEPARPCSNTSLRSTVTPRPATRVCSTIASTALHGSETSLVCPASSVDVSMTPH